MYVYYVIRGDPTFAKTTDTAALEAHLVGACNLVRKRDCVFVAGPEPSWAEVTIATADASGNYVVTSQGCSEHVNVIEVICSEADVDFGRVLAEQIADFVGWKAYCEDDG